MPQFAMPSWLHITLAILFTAYFLYRFIKDRYIYEILFVVWVPSTLLVYISKDPTFIRWLGIFQMVLFILVIFFMFRKRGARREKTLSILAKMAADKLPDEEVVETKDATINNNDSSNLK